MSEVRHLHHINPRHNGGGNEPENLISLSVPEHAEAHFLLYLEHGRWEDLQAALWLSNQNCDKDFISARNKANRAKQIITPESNKKRSETLKRKFQEGTFQPGVSHAPKTKEHNNKNSEANKKKWESGERKAVKSPGPKSEDGKKKCSAAAKARWDKWREENKKN